MFKKFNFYLRHAYINLRRNMQRTIFVLFCIAAGVAAIVSLRTLGLMIETALTESVQDDLKADLTIKAVPTDDSSLILEGSEFEPVSFSDEALERITQWATENGHVASPIRREQIPLQLQSTAEGALYESALPVFVDTETYPFYKELRLTAPDTKLLREAFTDPFDIVIAERLQTRLDVEIGEKVLLADREFTVVGVVDDASEASFSNLETLLFSIAYIDFQTGQELFQHTATGIALKLDEGADVVAVQNQFLEAFPGLLTRTTEDIRNTNASLTSGLTRLITMMGIGSLLIGGIGIVNTMLVIVRRRALEIGVLKTLGVQGHQITLMFMLEALAIGIIGSIAGCGLGIGFTRLLQVVGERATGRALAFTIYPEAIIIGLVTGIAVTLAFGFLPTLAAGRVRPNIVLNPNADDVIPAASRFLSTIVILTLTFVMGLLVGRILGNMPIGVVLAYIFLIAIGLLNLVMRSIVRMLTRLPSFGSVQIKLIQRTLEAQATRAASTLLALTIGMFALSSILLFTNTVIDLLDVRYDEGGGNIIAFGQTGEAGNELRQIAAGLPGVRDVTFEEIYRGELVAINGNDDMQALLEAATAAGVSQTEQREVAEQLQTFLGGLVVELPKDAAAYEVSEGAKLTADSTSSIILPPSDSYAWLGLNVGDSLTFRYNDGELQTVTIAGFMASSSDTVGFGGLDGFGGSDEFEEFGGFEDLEESGPMYGVISADVINANIHPEPQIFYINADNASIDETIAALSTVKDTFVTEASVVQGFLLRLVEQLRPLPIAIALLTLLASAVIIANTVSLATLERRREIGIMKALGLQTSQVLGMLLIENGLLGLLGGILGSSFGLFVSFIARVFNGGASAFLSPTFLWMLLLSTGIAIAATLATAVSAAREKPLNVLRYE